MVVKAGTDAFARSILCCIGLLFALSVSFAFYVAAEKDIDRANDIRFQTTRLADELRQSSDDLTRMIQTYVVTGDPSYKRHFQEILDIRNGVRPRPPHYERIYWDFVIAGNPAQAEDGERTPLLERMEMAGLTPSEATKLVTAKDRSDALTKIEAQAMALIEQGGRENRDRAMDLVFGREYLRYKADIMHPIDEFLAMIDGRTAHEVDRAIRRALTLRWLSIALGLILVATLIGTYRVLGKVLGGSVAEVHRQIAALGSGDFSSDIRVPPGGADSVLGWLAETRAKLTTIAAAKQIAETCLRDDQQKLRGLFDMSPLGIALTDMSGHFIEFNPAFLRITGYSAEELRTLDYWELTPPKYAEEEARQLESLAREGHYGPYEKEYRRKDGTLIPLCLNGVRIKSAEGREFIWSIVEDISERLAREQLLARSNAELEQFAYVASHDLQTPLRNIVSYSQLLERRYKGQLDSEANEFIHFIVEGGKHMSSLISDLLQYSRIQHQCQSLEPVSCDDCVQRTLANLHDRIHETGAAITAGPLPTVMADRSQLVSLFQNLVGNAIHYRHPDRRPEITISATPGDAGFWTFTVRDNGVGIAAEYHEKVFEMFQRLDPHAHPGGTGIGLALCRRIVHRLGGQIAVTDSSPDGTTFTFTLQAAPAGSP